MNKKPDRRKDPKPKAWDHFLFKQQQAKAVVAMIEAGDTLRQAAIAIGVTHQRISQIYFKSTGRTVLEYHTILKTRQAAQSADGLKKARERICPNCKITFLPMERIRTFCTTECREEHAAQRQTTRRNYQQRLAVGRIARAMVQNADKRKNRKTIICDLDGTLALFPGQNPYARDFEKDILNEPIAQILWQFAGRVKILLVSGRRGTFRDQTVRWLAKHAIFYDELYMRDGERDRRQDVMVKSEIYHRHIKDQHDVLFVLDDRDQVVKFWRSEGLTVLQVAEGNF